MKIRVKIKPNSKQEKVVQISSGEYEVWVHAPAQEGKANEALILLLSKHFKIAKSHIQIISGFSSRIKILELEN
ncbi:MAG: hypothetical protein A2Z91_02600 [Deltaproteobacteria bacterium GWA2_38_16]|nr:MAG: hypothetical protein A2Z91_02600 [Deltaproteobacteria bacterium GWA2_38_16]OGQ02083.1 MAG: hypothetical protein A3D19_08895 [Deltaproteobacteria bacterium RIFCSPHIGHO2_02_FULL_38_15]OGQ32533.1 MAG: hypothetical protein A3A72_03040 [Deltaproteobacteria bacterium RIFCSPLOWO2_01_FULL_38_9]OGQ63060.1 MAG: hypothetical protein A3G92_05390 [Deltaproteobacteria bacterium RIFCSPLOWO2_12_FULL_38_8]HBQ21621.1 hypothetical protein [Deltaproteobacteria bacterium]